MFEQISHEEMAPVIGSWSQDLLSSVWTPRKATGFILVQVRRPEIQGSQMCKPQLKDRRRPMF